MSALDRLRNEVLADPHSLLCGEFVLLVGRHELWGQSEGSQTQGTLRASADIMHKRHCPLIEVLLVMVLVLDEIEVAKVAHVGAGIPPNVIRINVNFPKSLDHLGLIRDVGFHSGRGGRGIEMRAIVL